MAHVYKARVADQTLTTGVGPLGLIGVPIQANLRTPSTVMTFGDSAYFIIVNESSGEWEEGLYTYSALNQLLRTSILDSSNNGHAVNFSPGIKDVVLTTPALTSQLADQNVIAFGQTVLDFGIPPGRANASVTITGQQAILATSGIEARIMGVATADHTVDEHWVDPPAVSAGNIAAGVGFTIFGTARDFVPVIGRIAGQGLYKYPRASMPYGKWTVVWRWK